MGKYMAHRIAKVVTLEKAMIKQALYDEFGDDQTTIDRIDAAFKKGADDTTRHLGAIIGDSAEAKRLIDYVETAEIPDAAPALPTASAPDAKRPGVIDAPWKGSPDWEGPA
jgi:hypothetical protein